MEIKGKVAWITGGNSGMGEATARWLIERGAKVMITARGVTADGAAVAERLGENCMWVKADSRNPEELEAAAAELMKKWGRLDILVSSAGASPPGGVIVTEDKDMIAAATYDMEESFRLNIMGNFHAARIAATLMAKNEPSGPRAERGVIIMIASMAADKIWILPPPGTPETWYGYGYGMAKAALLGLSRDMAFALAPLHIRCNIIKPGWFITPLTPFSEEMEKNGGNPTQLFPKFGGKPDEIAHLCVTMIENAFINRAQYEIDAGVMG